MDDCAFGTCDHCSFCRLNKAEGKIEELEAKQTKSDYGIPASEVTAAIKSALEDVGGGSQILDSFNCKLNEAEWSFLSGHIASTLKIFLETRAKAKNEGKPRENL